MYSHKTHNTQGDSISGSLPNLGSHPTHSRRPSLLPHQHTHNIPMPITTTPDTFSDEPPPGHHSNSNSYTPGFLGAEAAAEETQHNGSRLRNPSFRDLSTELQLQQQQLQQRQSGSMDMSALQQRQSGGLDMSALQQRQSGGMDLPSPGAFPRMHSIQEQQQLVLQQQQQQQLQQQQQQQRYPPRRAPSSNQGSAHGGMAMYGIPVPYPLGNDSQNPSLHGGNSLSNTVRVIVCMCVCFTGSSVACCL